MVQFSHDLDSAFAALADPTRRGILERLTVADASISDLAVGFGITLTGIKKHVAVLERSGLVATAKRGRVRTCSLGPRRLADEAEWIARYRQCWETRFNELDAVIEELQARERRIPSPQRKRSRKND